MTSKLPAFRLPVFGVLVAIVGACGDPLKPIATLPTTTDTVTVYALNGTPSSAPNALALFDGARVRADVTFGFDVVFDLNAGNQVMVIPVRRLTSVAGGFQVAMQVVSGEFASVTEAPKSGYHNDSTFVVGVGTVLAIQSANPSVCGLYSASPYHYAKLAVTAIDPVIRTIALSFAVDRNCGFRQLTDGIPDR